jgi:hypothetical protein
MAIILCTSLSDLISTSTYYPEMSVLEKSKLIDSSIECLDGVSKNPCAILQDDVLRSLRFACHDFSMLSYVCYVHHFRDEIFGQF